MTLTISDLEELLRLLEANPELLRALQDRIVDEQTILRLLSQRAEVREALRRYVLQDELLELPTLVRELIEIQRHHQAILQEHTQILREHSRILQQHSEQLAQLVEITRRHDEQLAQLVEISRRHDEQLAQLVEISRRHDEQLAQLVEISRRHDEQLAQLVEISRRHDEQLAQLVEISRRHDEQLAQLGETTRRHDEELAQLVEISRQHGAILREHSSLLMRLSQSWEGERGRRAGERYERWVIKRATVLMRGGMGGETDQPEVRRRLTQWLARIDSAPLLKEEEADPSLADLIWWKDDQVLVVEVSLKVDSRDVLRARRRATTLQQAGVQAIPVVMGEEWLHLDVRDFALHEGVEWYVQGDMSPGFEAFRSLPFDVE